MMATSMQHSVDRGWAWVVLLGAHVVNFLMNGGYKSLGILFVEFRDIFGESAAMTAVMFGVIQGGTALTTPIATAIGERIGHRWVVMTGGFLCASAAFIAAFAPNMTFIATVFGGITAIGYGCQFSPTMVMVGTYFDKRRALANGLAFAGGSMGMLLIPIFMRYITDTYGFRGALIIFSGCLLHMIAGGAVFRPLSRKKEKNPLPRFESMDNLFDKIEASQPDKETYDIASSDDKDTAPNTLVDDGEKLYKTIPEEDRDGPPIDGAPTCSLDDKQVSISLKIEKKRKLGNIFSCCYQNSSFCDRPCLDMSVLSSVVFVVYLVAIILSHPGYVNSFIFLPAYANELGISKNAASIILAMSGVCDLIGCILGGAFADLHQVRRRRYVVMATALTVAGSAGILCPLFPSIYSVCTMIAAVGLFGGCYFALIAVVLVDFVGVEKMANALGITIMSIGITNTFLPSILGFIKDAGGGFSGAFQLCGSMMLISGVLVFSCPLVERIQKRRQKLIIVTIP